MTAPKFFNKFFSFDGRSLALFRIALAVVILIDLITRAGDLAVFYTDAGLLPRTLLLEQAVNPWNISLYLFNGTYGYAILLFFINAMLALALLAGWRTRIVTFLLWLFMISLHVRNPLVTDSGDYLLRVLLFWSLFLPLNNRGSVDRALDPSLVDPPKNFLSAGTFAYSVQICLMYWFAAAFKTTNGQWQSGQAVFFALSMDAFATPLGAAVRQFPELCRLFTYGTIAFEWGGPFLLLMSGFSALFRMAVLAAFWGLHAGFGLCLELAGFPWVDAVAIIPFIPGGFWDALSKWNFQEKIRFSAPRFFSSLPARPLHWKQGKISKGIALFFILHALLWNIWTLKPSYRIPGLVGIADLFQMDQQWSVFTPGGTYTGWYIMVGKLVNGEEVDMLQEGKPVDWNNSKHPLHLYKNSRWRTYLLYTIWDDANQVHHPYYAWHLCQEWNNKNPDPRKVKRVDIHSVFQVFYPTREPQQTNLLYSHECL